MTSLQHHAIFLGYKARVDSVLVAQLPVANHHSERLRQAMHYAILNGGKRLRPILVYATGEALGVDAARLDAPACAIELIHTYSLIHDDLPAMDNDDWRRGQPSCHKAFDEATAILAGDALQALAFQCLAQGTQYNLTGDQCLRMIRILANASGVEGMVGGQALDLEATGQLLDEPKLSTIHRLKTGALISACIEFALIAADQDQATALAPALRTFAQHFGLAFQIQDDILDVEGTLVTLGKHPGRDQQQGKLTYPTIVGLTAAKTQLQCLRKQALDMLDTLSSPATKLREVTESLLKSF